VALAPNDLGGADAVLSIVVDAPIAAFLLRNNTWLDHGVAVIENDELRLSGAVDALSAALADVTLIPASDWHGHARLRLNLTEHGVELASTTIELDVEGVQDAPVIIDGGGPYEVEEDTYLPLSIKLIDPDYDHAEDPHITCSLRVSARRGALRIVGGQAFAALSGSLLEDGEGILLKGTPTSITSTLTKLEYISALDWHGDDFVDIVADDGTGLVATLQIPIRVHAVRDAPRITSPDKVLYDEVTKGVALGRNGTKTETPVPGVSVYDPDSEVVRVTLTASGGRVKVVGHVKDVESDAGTESPSSYQRILKLRATQAALNAALSTLTWVPDDQIAERDGFISGTLRVEASDGVLTNDTTISIRAAAYNDPPRITGDVSDVLVTEDSDWLSLPPLEASDEDDRIISLSVTARSEGALEVHAIKTTASVTTRSTAVHVVRVANASNATRKVERGAFRLVVDLRGVEGLPEGAATRAVTDSIAFDAVARIDDERTGSTGERLRENDGLNPDLSHQSVEAKLLSLPNVKKSGMRVTVSREDYAAFGSQHYDRYDSLGGARYVDDYEVRRSYYKSLSRPAPVNGGHEWRITFQGSIPEAASSPMSIDGDASIWAGLLPSVETVRHANSIHGSFQVQVKGYSTEVAHNASSTDLQRALMTLPSVTAVLVTRSEEDESGGFEWSCTFFESSVDLRVDGAGLRGEHASITSTLVRARSGDPSLYKIDVTHDSHIAIHALSLKQGRNFVRIGLDTRNCSTYQGGSHYLAEGSLRFTRPIPRIAQGTVEEEVDGIAEFNRGFDHAYPPHSLPGPNSSVEAHLLSLPNWSDLGPEASIQVSKHDNQGTTVWRVTFSHVPHALPLLRVIAVEGNDNRNLDVLSLIDEEEDTWDASNTSITRRKSYASRAGLKSRSSPEASSSMEREASQLRGTWRLRWGSDETWSRPLATDATASSVKNALESLPSLQMPHPDRRALLVVSRARVAQGGFVYYIAFERDAYITGDFQTDPSSLRGPSTKRCRVTRLRDATNAGTVRISSVASLARVEGDPHEGSSSFSVAGAPHAISEVLQTWSFRPAPNYSGRVVVDASVKDGRNASSYAGLTVVVENQNDAPSVLFPRGTYALVVDEDSEARVVGIEVGDVDAAPGEVHTLTLEAKHGVLAVHRTATDARFGGEATYTEALRRGVVTRERVDTRRVHPEAASSINGPLILRGSLSKINAALSTLSYISHEDWHGVDTLTVTAADASNATTTAELLIRVRPVNDFPIFTIDSTQRDAEAAQHPDHAASAGRGTSLLYGRHDHLSDKHDALTYYRRNNATSNHGICVPVVYETSATDAPVAHGTCSSKWSSAEDNCFDEEGCVSCDGDPEKWCMVDTERWCYCSTQVDSVIVPSRYVEEDQGCVIVGGLAVHDADVRFAYGRDFSDSVPWPAHLQISAEVEDGVLALRSGDKRGAAAVLEHAFEGDAFENLEVVAGDAIHGDKALVMRGTLGAINLALQALCYEPDANWNGVDVLRLSAKDGGDAAHGSGGVKTSEVRLALHVRGVRDSPVVSAPMMDVEALEDAVIQFGGEKTDEIYVSSTFSIVDGDLEDLTKPLRRWLVPHSDSLDSINTKTYNRFDADATNGTYAYVDGNHPTWLGSIQAHTDAGQLSSPSHGFTRTPVVDRYALHISSRRGGLRLPHTQGWPHSILLENYTLFQANRALQGLLYKPDLHWNSQHASHLLADVGTQGGVTDDIALENISVTIEDATGLESSASLLFFVHPVNDPPVLEQSEEILHREKASSDQLSRLRLSPSTLLVKEDSTRDGLGLNVRDVDCADVALGEMDVSLVVHRGSLKVDGQSGDMIHLHGSPSQVSLALTTLAYTPSQDYAGDDSLFVTASDRGNTGRGGALTSTMEVPLFVDSACDPPVIQPIQTVVATNEDDGVAVGFEVSDADHANLDQLYRLHKFRAYTNATFFPDVQVVLSAGNGTLTLDSSIRSALTFIEGRGVSEATMTFRATLEHAKTALAHVSYEPSRDYFTLPITDVAADTVTLELDDLGLDFGGLPEGLGQKCASLKTTGTIRIQINAVNDRPHIAVPGAVYKALPGGTDRSSLRRDLELMRVKPLSVDEDAILELRVRVDDDGDDARAFPAAEGALTISVERGTFFLDCAGEALDPRDAPFATAPQSTTGRSIRLRVTPDERDACLKTLRFRGLPDDHSQNSSITVGYEDGGYGSVREAAGVSGCKACAPMYGTSVVEPSLWDVKTIPIIILPKADPPSIQSPYDDGVSVVVEEDRDLYLPHVQVVDPDGDPSYVLRASTTHGLISLGLDAWSPMLRFEVGDGDADPTIVARGPLSAVNAALHGLLYKPSRDFTASDQIDLLVEDVNNYGRTASLSIPIRVSASVDWNDAPVLRIPNETRVGTPCLAKPQSSLLRTRGVNSVKEYPQCDRRLAVAAFTGFEEDVPRRAFGGLRVSDDGSRLKVTLVCLRGTLRFDSFDSLGLESLREEPKHLVVRGEPELLNAAFAELEYVSDAHWHGVDHLNISVTDAHSHVDGATILLDVASRPDAPFVEMRSDEEASYFRGTEGETRYEEGVWERVLRFDVRAEEDRRIRLPSLRVRDLDAEANRDTLEAAARGLRTAASALREQHHKIEQDASLRLDISVEHGKISLCSIRCPGVLFVEASHDSEASRRTGEPTDGDVVRRGWPELVQGGRAASGEVLQLLDAAPVRREDGLLTGTNLKWWRNATLRGTAANLNAALWDLHYWPALNYNSEDGRARDHLSLSIVDEAGSEKAHTVDAAISIAAVNDRPVVRAARLETVSVTSKGDVQTTGDGLSLIAVDVNDEALVTNEDEPLPLQDLFTVRDVDTHAALEIAVTTTHGRSSFSSQVSEVVFLEPSSWSNASSLMSRGASHIRFLSTEEKANALLASLIFTPKRDWHGKASVTVACNDRGVGGLGGPLSHAQSVRIRVRQANDAPIVRAPELGGGYALYLDQGMKGKLEGASHEEAGRYYRQTQWTAAEAAAYVYDVDDIQYQYPFTLEAHAGYELWRSAPTRDDDVDARFYDSEPVIGWESSLVHDVKHPRFFVNYDQRLFFAATDEKHGAELWSTDGSITNMNADVMPGRSGSDPRYLTVYEDLLYFSAAGHSSEEWRVADIYRDECDSMRRSSFDPDIAFVVSSSNEWQPGKTYDCPQGWRWMDSEEALRTFTGRNYGPSQGGRDESALKKRKDMATNEERVYYGQCGWDAWTYGNVQREHFRFSDSHVTGLYKAASSPDSRRPDVDLTKGGWQGIELKTSRFAGIVCVADPDSYDVAPTGRELWASDGSPRGTYRAVQSPHSDPQYLTVHDNALFFGASSQYGRELHRFSKEDGVMRLVADIRRGPDSSDPKRLTSCGGVLWFVATDGLRGDELYASDGVLPGITQRGEAGTRLAKDIRPGQGSSSPNHFVCLNNVLLFAATTDDAGRELWKASWPDLTDSSTLSVSRVADIHSGHGSSSPEYLAVLHNKVYFSADDGRVGRELWKTDGTQSGTRLVADARLGSLGSSPRYLTLLDDRLFYVARTADPADQVDRTIEAPVSTRLWATDGSRANTKPVFDTTGNSMDLDRTSLDAGGGALATLGKALYYPARRGSTKLDGGLTQGHSNRGKGKPQAFAVHDADDDVLTLELSVVPREAGGLSLDVAPPPSVDVLEGDLTMDETQTFRGTSAHLNLLLADLWFAAAPSYSGAVEIQASVRDDPLRCVANVTDGCERGENATGVATVRVFVRRHNQAPTVSIMKGPVGASSEGWHRFESFASVGDPDADDADLGVDAATGLRIEPRLVVTLTVQKGVVSLGATDARLSFIEGTGVEDRRVVVDASVAALNDALGVVTYACENCELGSDEITVEVDDGGFSGLGGPMTAAATVEVTIVRR
jgi:ELWxxDGT repeat protein